MLRLPGAPSGDDTGGCKAETLRLPGIYEHLQLATSGRNSRDRAKLKPEILESMVDLLADLRKRGSRLFFLGSDCECPERYPSFRGISGRDLAPARFASQAQNPTDQMGSGAKPPLNAYACEHQISAANRGELQTLTGDRAAVSVDPRRSLYGSCAEPFSSRDFP